MVLVYESSPGYYYIVKDGKSKDGKSKDGKLKDGKLKDGKLKDGKSKDGKSKDGKSKDGKKVNKVYRISKDEYDKNVNKYNYNRDSIKVGDKVTIIIKPYKDGKYVTGQIKKILTKKKIHTRGHKVLLQDGTIGRMVRKEK